MSTTATAAATQTFSLVELYSETIHITGITDTTPYHEVLTVLNKANPGSLYVLQEM